VAAPQILSDAFRRLIRKALDRESAGFSEFLAKWLEFLELRGTAPSFDLIHAVPNLNHDTRLRRVSFQRGDVLSGSKNTSAAFLDQSLSLGGVFFCPAVKIRYVDLGDVIDRRLGLRMKALDGRCSKGRSGKHRQGNRITSFHDLSPYFMRARLSADAHDMPADGSVPAH
jgi:hypothetical protein